MYSMYKNPGYDSDNHSSKMSIGSRGGELSRMLNKNAINSNRFFILDRENLKKLAIPENINDKSLFRPEDYSINHKQDLDNFHKSMTRRNNRAIE